MRALRLFVFLCLVVETSAHAQILPALELQDLVAVTHDMISMSKSKGSKKPLFVMIGRGPSPVDTLLELAGYDVVYIPVSLVGEFMYGVNMTPAMDSKLKSAIQAALTPELLAAHDKIVLFDLHSRGETLRTVAPAVEDHLVEKQKQNMAFDVVAMVTNDRYTRNDIISEYWEELYDIHTKDREAFIEQKLKQKLAEQLEPWPGLRPIRVNEGRWLVYPSGLPADKFSSRDYVDRGPFAKFPSVMIKKDSAHVPFQFPKQNSEYAAARAGIKAQLQSQFASTEASIPDIFLNPPPLRLSRWEVKAEMPPPSFNEEYEERRALETVKPTYETPKQPLKMSDPEPITTRSLALSETKPKNGCAKFIRNLRKLIFYSGVSGAGLHIYRHRKEFFGK